MKHRAIDEGELKRYFTAIPNIVYKLGLTTFELSLYNVIKQSAGDEGTCWKSRATLAKESGMSAGMVTKARLTLEKSRMELDGKPLIRVREEQNTHGGKPFCIISVVDIWPQNMATFATSHSDFVNQATSHSVSTTSQSDRATSPHAKQRHRATTKKNTEEKPKKKNNEELFPPFHGDEFLATLADFEAHRKEIRKPLKPTGRKQLYSQLAGLGESRAVAALRYSMAQGWTGVFEEHKNGASNGHRDAADRNADRLRANLAITAELRGEDIGDNF